MHYSKLSYNRREAARLAASRRRQQREQDNRYTQVDKFLHCFEQTYVELYKVHITVQYKNGWYNLHHVKLRKKELEKQLLLMLVKLHEMEFPPLED